MVTAGIEATVYVRDACSWPNLWTSDSIWLPNGSIVEPFDWQAWYIFTERWEWPIYSIWYAKQSNSGITGTITSANAFNNDGQTHKQQIHMANINAILLPVEFGNEKYKLPNLVYQKAYGIAYDDEL